ncbi:hypothetical protein [Anaerosporobacter sp.]|uniref:hypothetical protein n=1 Tax=Anaerosporobacter sp. TaxID=1872529 RepID=UPI00286EDBB1|nr:hypothetical protein [Anaerosporobacter sp.]
MNKKVFKVGDRVRVINNGETCSCYEEFIDRNAPKYIDKYKQGFLPDNGSVGVVVGCGVNTAYRDSFLAVLSEGKVFCICEEGVETIQNASIHITTDENKVIAVMKEGKQEVGRGVAVCNHSDEFDFKIGAKLALTRLFGEDAMESAVSVEPINEYLSFKKVKRRAESGEYVLIVNADFHRDCYKNGEIYRVKRCLREYAIITTEKTYVSRYTNEHESPLLPFEYVVLEDYQSPTVFNQTEDTFTKEQVLEMVEKVLLK